MPVHGNVLGLKPNQKSALERLARRNVPAQRIVTPELATALSMLSREIGRQVGVFIDRNGQVTDVAVGDAQGIMLPDFGRVRAGAQRFRGLRFVHTHLKQEPLNHEDLTDLAKLRLDMIVAVGVGPDGVPGAIFLAHLLPPSPSGEVHRTMGPLNMGALPDNFVAWIDALETEFEHVVRAPREVISVGRALLVHVATDSRRLLQAQQSLDELAELARSAGVVVLDTVLQLRTAPDRLYVMGKGKLQEVTLLALQQDADLLIMDCNLGANQARAISDLTELKVIDRTQLILDIFAQRAHSVDGKLKVELAQLKYLLPRLSALDDSLSRLTGGIGGRGPGETKLEIGRRRARERVARLEKQLKHLQKGREQRRAKRQRSEIPIVSIVGYTNAGKSTLLNTLTQSAVFTENLLFATLETSSRRLRFPREREIIITDTVGFIRDLPKDLIDAFKATLEELEDASLLLQLVDFSDPNYTDHMRAVEQVLMDLSLSHLPRLLVLNKADKVDAEFARTRAEALQGVAISARDKTTLPALLQRIEHLLWHRLRDDVDDVIWLPQPKTP